MLVGPTPKTGKFSRGQTYEFCDGAFQLYQDGAFVASFVKVDNMKNAAHARTQKGATGTIRPCMCCRDNFYSDHIGVRLCKPCKNSDGECLK